jgi:hypothetical protein
MTHSIDTSRIFSQNVSINGVYFNSLFLIRATIAIIAESLGSMKIIEQK